MACLLVSICLSHIALLPEVALASAPVPICSKIWEVCFDVNTVLDDPPINSGGATRSRHCSLLGGATRTRHDDAISGKRLTMPCDSDFLCVSLIRDGLAHSAQHSFLGQIFFCPRCVPTCTQCFRVCLASVQPGFLLYRRFHCWRDCSSCFPGCPHVLLHQCFIDVSSSPRRLRDRVSVFSLIPATVSTASPCAQHVCCLTSIRIPVGSISFLCTSCVFPSALHRTTSV